MVAGGDSHTCTYGALGAFGTGLGSTDIAACLAFRRVLADGPRARSASTSSARRRPFVTGKDLILAVIEQIGVGGRRRTPRSSSAAPGADALSIDERLAVANMAVEGGAETGFFPADDTTAEYLQGRVRQAWSAERSDPDVLISTGFLLATNSAKLVVVYQFRYSRIVPQAGQSGFLRSFSSRNLMSSASISSRRPISGSRCQGSA